MEDKSFKDQSCRQAGMQSWILSRNVILDSQLRIEAQKAAGDEGTSKKEGQLSLCHTSIVIGRDTHHQVRRDPALTLAFLASQSLQAGGGAARHVLFARTRHRISGI